MAPFLDLDNLKPFVDKELADSTKPVVFRVPRGGKAYGYRADLLPRVCEVYLRARDEGKLLTSQEKFAKACEIIVRGLAHVGIVALVDEATGYQAVRARHDLAEILQRFISKELKKWARRFPFEFYEKIFRLKGWDASELTPNSPKPLEVGRITDDLIYRRLAPGVRAELKRLMPRNEKGYLVNKLHQHLTDDIGNPKLEKHLAVTMALMDVSSDWPTFMAHMNKALPPFGKNYELALDDERRARIDARFGRFCDFSFGRSCGDDFNKRPVAKRCSNSMSVGARTRRELFDAEAIAAAELRGLGYVVETRQARS